MKQLTCEMCGSTELIKQDGVFVCQSCGCKYSVEEARKMMVEGTVEVTGTVKVDNSAQVNNFLELSQNAYNSGNGQSAFDYANKALEIAPQNPQAWICKMKSIEYIGTLGSLRMMEVIEAGKNAVNFASDEEKDSITYQVYKYELIRALELLKLAMNKMSDSADIKRTFQQFSMISVFTAAQNTLTADSKVVNIYDGVANEAVAVVKLVPDSVINNNKELAKLVGECAKQYQYVTNALIERYKIYGATLLDSALSTRNSTKRALQEKSDKAIRAIEAREAEEKRVAAEKRFNEYWASNANKKVELESERSELEQKITALQSQIKAIKGDEEIKSIQAKIDTLTKEKSSLGLFKGKEKKAVQEKIDAAKSDMQTIQDRMKAERSAIEKEIEPLSSRVKSITRELTMPR